MTLSCRVSRGATSGSGIFDIASEHSILLAFCLTIMLEPMSLVFWRITVRRDLFMATCVICCCFYQILPAFLHCSLQKTELYTWKRKRFFNEQRALSVELYSFVSVKASLLNELGSHKAKLYDNCLKTSLFQLSGENLALNKLPDKYTQDCLWEVYFPDEMKGNSTSAWAETGRSSSSSHRSSCTSKSK